MTDWKNGRFEQCERFREELEALQIPLDRRIERNELLTKLGSELREHAETCGSCLEAADDLVELRNLLRAGAHEAVVFDPGPWFTSKVMNAISAKETEIEQSEGVWQSVRRLAPRLAAVCALVLVLAGTWAAQVRRNDVARQRTSPGESLFETAPSSVLNDDVLLSAEAHR